MLRLFRRGHSEEGKVISELMDIGIKYTRDKDGFSDIHGHFRGHSDGFLDGVPGYENERILFECKTSNTKDFRLLAKNGVRKTKPTHYAQIQAYLGYSRLKTAMYVVVCKETDEFYIEFVRFSKDSFDGIRRRAFSILRSDDPPMRISDNKTYYLCKMCPMHGFCHLGEKPDPNIRNDGTHVPGRGGEWVPR